MRVAQKELADFGARVAPMKDPTAAPPFKSLDEVPADVATNAIGDVRENKVLKELNEGWEVWRTNRALAGFPDSALTDADTFKAYLRARIAEEWSEASNYYTRLLWEVEQWENAMLNYHTGDDFAELFFPRVPEGSVSSGIRTFLRNQETMMTNYEAGLQGLDEWKRYLADLADNGHPAFVLPSEMKAELLGWSKRASEDKAQLQDIIINGGSHEGRDYAGAIAEVNRRMIDYQYSNNFDNIMRNFFPFWKFPSRSFPFWAQTMATHPQLIANYEKIQRLSRSQRYQSGAVTSSGKPLPSLDGYIKIPGTDMWFNPLAPLSFRYILDISKTKDDVLYQANTSEEEVEPNAFMVKEMMQTGQVYGFSLAPWMAYLMKQAYQIPDEVLPRYPFSPLIPLIPRWAIQDLIAKSERITLPFGWDAQEIAQNITDAAYPEVPWHDYLVERRILEQTLAQIQGSNLTDAQKMKLVNEAKEAIKLKGDNPLWQQSYKDITNDSSLHSIFSYVTGFHAKEFSDSQALLLQLRNERNQLKSALNNEFQATLFDIPTDADTAWNRYLTALNSPEGWVYRLYTDMGWVKDDTGKLVRDPKDRAKYLAIKIEQDEDQEIYYQKMAELQNWYNDTLRALPVGADWEQVKTVYEKYAEKRAALDYLRSYEKFYGTNKPRELIERDITNDWFKAINATRPRWDVDKGETYEQYQARVAEWEQNIANVAPILMRSFARLTDLNKTLDVLHDDQKLDPGFLAQLAQITNKESLEMWQKESDDIFDALNNAWTETYWKEYWNSIVGKSGYEVDLAERDFYTQHPEPPDAQGLYAWIQGYYGPDKFTLEEVRKWVDGTDSYSIEERRIRGIADPDDHKKRQEIWDMLAMIGPGGRNRGVFETAFKNAGGDMDTLTVWYEESGEAYRTKPEKLDALHDALERSIQTLNLKPPTRAELVKYIQAQEEQDLFKKAVTDELGSGFFDWVDKDGTPHVGLLTYYGQLGYEEKKEFQRYNRDLYDTVQSYYDMKEDFEENHPTWAEFYGYETEPTVSLPYQPITSSILTPPNPQQPTGQGGGGGQPSRSPTRSDNVTAPAVPAPPAPLPTSGTGTQPAVKPDYVPSFRLDSRISTNVSPGLLNLVGQKMAWEIQSIESGRKISSSGISFLRSVASRYPEYRAEIQEILSRGT
jgi:hypothetical protein